MKVRYNAEVQYFINLKGMSNTLVTGSEGFAEWELSRSVLIYRQTVDETTIFSLCFLENMVSQNTGFHAQRCYEIQTDIPEKFHAQGCMKLDNAGIKRRENKWNNLIHELSIHHLFSWPISCWLTGNKERGKEGMEPLPGMGEVHPRRKFRFDSLLSSFILFSEGVQK